MCDLKKYGDLLEKTYHEFINSELPNYELIWDKFVSKNYKLNSDDSKIKRLISEYNYTCFESLISIKNISEKDYYNFLSSEQNDIKKTKQYIELTNDVIVFEAHLGRIYETMKRIWGKLQMKENNKMKEFYHHRHNVIHSHKIPVSFMNNIIAIPELNAQGNENGWNDKKDLSWTDFFTNTDNIQAIDDYFKDVFERLTVTMNEAFSSIMSKITSKYLNDWELLDDSVVNPEFNVFSGTTMEVRYE